jgi:hypothetical protein
MVSQPSNCSGPLDYAGLLQRAAFTALIREIGIPSQLTVVGCVYASDRHRQPSSDS